MKKPKWVVEKEQAKKAAAQETVWLFGLHAVRDALLNPNRQHLRLILTKNVSRLKFVIRANLQPRLILRPCIRVRPWKRNR
jgi:23S rRNA (guanosine2251-2'-O)-methyltransferase